MKTLATFIFKRKAHSNVKFKKVFLSQSEFCQHTVVEREITGSTKIVIVLEARPELFAVLKYIGLIIIQPSVQKYTGGKKTANLKFKGEDNVNVGATCF